ncbi:MAG TPA: glycosyltransferase family 4 protein [Bacillota bacterium]|nr:glycosyltransferase family 4 protein [Bacillota bacterium]
MGDPAVTRVGFVARVYLHLYNFHLPYMQMLRSRGFEVHVYGGNDCAKRAIEQAGFICHDIPFRRNPFNPVNLKALAALLSGFRRQHLQLIHVHTPIAAALSRIAARLTGIPKLIYTAHGFHFYGGCPLTGWLLYYPVERLLARWTDFLITLNDEDYQRALKFKVREKVYMIQGVGLDIEEFYQNSAPPPDLVLNRPNYFVILQAGELNANKNPLQIIKAVEKIVNQGRRVQCLLVGCGPQESELKRAVRKAGLQQYINFLGYRSDIPALMREADVIVNMSIREGLPKVLIEGMAGGKPILATDIRGNRDLIKHGVNGLLVPVGDIEATSRALDWLMDNPSLRQTMGAVNKEHSRSFELSCRLKDLEKIYLKALSSRKELR